MWIIFCPAARRPPDRIKACMGQVLAGDEPQLAGAQLKFG